ncbi:hypothetical protein VTK73DRAFT_5506 [Phialemonium thermophilum]|uniref:Small ribosomal subunit protein uS7 domain-containing protein n=1 Tax=Phialemonium thermophilum TaxID=223376 RepID=A0ABR3WN71_9PEZI
MLASSRHKSAKNGNRDLLEALKLSIDQNGGFSLHRTRDAMPPPAGLRTAVRALAIRSRPLVQCQRQPRGVAIVSRGFAEDTTTGVPPRLPEKGADSLPPSMARSSQPPSSSPSPQTAEGAVASSSSSRNEEALKQLEMVAYGLNPYDPQVEGHKYGLPDLPLHSQAHMKHRYHPVVAQVTNLLMRDGKLSKAQRHMSMILNFLRTWPPPKANPARPLLPGSPPPSHLPLDPVVYLTVAIDSVAPLIRIRSYRGMIGGGASLEVPMPLAARQRRRVAFQWILDVVNKKKSKGSGRTTFAHRVAEEIVAVVEGRSSVWDKRQQVHKQGTTARANLNNPQLVRKLAGKR